ncbi:histidine phosphatase family protein [Tropicimonas isoalkanivorans]
MNGWTDVPADLSDIPQLDRLADFLPAEAAIVSSDLVRAVATADALQRGRARLPHERGLREIHFGTWEAKTFDAVDAQDPQLARLYWESPGDVRPPGGESWNDLSRRVDRVVDWLTGEEGDIIAVSHFGPILSQVMRARACTPAEVLAETIAPLSVTRLAWDGTRWTAELVNHLP